MSNNNIGFKQKYIGKKMLTSLNMFSTAETIKIRMYESIGQIWVILFEPHYKKACFLHMLKHRCRSAAQ